MYHNIIKGTSLEALYNNQKTKILEFKIKFKTRPESRDYWKVVAEWENKLGKEFGEIVADLRLKHSPEELINHLGVSRGFIYYHFGAYMNRINYLEKKYNKSISLIVKELRKQGKTMDDISIELGLAVTTLYNHLKKTS